MNRLLTIRSWPFWCRLVAIFTVTAFLCARTDAAGTDSVDNPVPRAAVTAIKKIPAVEVVRERYLDGRVKIEREVTTDADDNYVNHGTWRMWDPAGKLVAEGSYAMGQRTGEWTRWLARDEATLLSTPPFDQFDAPFVARAHFDHDRMDGEWTIEDASGRKCASVSLKNGRRNGAATLWLPDGQIDREASFQNGLPVGNLRERDADSVLKTVASYIDGQQLLNKVVHFANSEQKQIECGYLGATIIEVAPDDFWQMRFASYAVRGNSLRHGPWKCWYANGQLQSEGYYQYDRESGVFTWWHAHGQEAVRGHFTDGQPDGTWTWWHANGQKAAEGQYHAGSRVGIWRQWADDGRLVRRRETQNASYGNAEFGPVPRLSQHRQPAENSF